MLNNVSDTNIVSAVHVMGPALILENHSGNFKVNGETVHLTAQEKSLLLYLMEGKGQVRTKTMLLAHVAEARNVDCRLIDVLVCKIRSKLKQIDSKVADNIRPVWGRGYAWGYIKTIPPALWNHRIPKTARWVPSRKESLIRAMQLYKVGVTEIQAHYPDFSTGGTRRVGSRI